MAFYIVKPWYKKSGGVKVVPFSTGTDAEIAAMLDAYYNGELTWAEMGWAVGDTRLIHLDGFACPDPYSSSSISAQDVTVVIVDHDHNTLATAINGITKACITVQFREALGKDGGKDGSIYINGDTSLDKSFSKWSALYMRTYMSNVLLPAFTYSTNKGSGTSFKDMLKTARNVRHTTHSSTASENVDDILFLPSYCEVFGTKSYTNYQTTSPTEGSQFAYYATAANRKKYKNNNGSAGGSSVNWWTSSPSKEYTSVSGYRWIYVDYNGEADRYVGSDSAALAPVFVM